MRLRQVTDLDLKLLRSFAEIVERGGFAAAQAALNISQSVLSGHVKTLEVRLGFVLCKRGPGGFKLLPEGERVYKAAKEVFSAIDDFKLGIGDIGDEMSGEVRVVVEDGIVANPSCRLAEAFGMFGERAGNRVRVRLETMPGYQAISLVADGSAHLAVSVANVRVRDVRGQPLFDEVVELHCGATHPLFKVRDADITQEVLAGFAYSNRGHLESKSLSMITSAFRRGDLGLGSDAHLLNVLSGRNLAYVPQHLAGPFIQAGRLRAICPAATRHIAPVQLVTRDTVTEAKLVSVMRSCIVTAHATTALPGSNETRKLVSTALRPIPTGAVDSSYSTA